MFIHYTPYAGCKVPWCVDQSLPGELVEIVQKVIVAVYRGDFNSLASCQFVAVRRDEVDVTSKDVRTFGRADIR